MILYLSILLVIILVLYIVFLNYKKNKTEGFSNDPIQMCRDLGYTHVDMSDKTNPVCVFTSEEVMARCGINRAEPNGIFDKCIAEGNARNGIMNIFESNPEIYTDCPKGYEVDSENSMIHSKICQKKLEGNMTDRCRANVPLNPIIDSSSNYVKTNVDMTKEGSYRGCHITCDPEYEKISVDIDNKQIRCERTEEDTKKLKHYNRKNRKAALERLNMLDSRNTFSILPQNENSQNYVDTFFKGFLPGYDKVVSLKSAFKNKGTVTLLEVLYSNIFENSGDGPTYTQNKRENLPMVMRIENGPEYVVYFSVRRFNNGEFNNTFHSPSNNKRELDVIRGLNKLLSLEKIVREEYRKLYDNKALFKDIFGDIEYYTKGRKRISRKITEEELQRKIQKMKNSMNSANTMNRGRRRRRIQKRMRFLSNLQLNTCIPINQACFNITKVVDLDDRKLNNFMRFVKEEQKEVFGNGKLFDYTRNFQSYVSVRNLVDTMYADLKTRVIDKVRERNDKIRDRFENCEIMANETGC